MSLANVLVQAYWWLGMILAGIAVAICLFMGILQICVWGVKFCLHVKQSYAKVFLKAG